MGIDWRIEKVDSWNWELSIGIAFVGVTGAITVPPADIARTRVLAREPLSLDGVLLADGVRQGLSASIFRRPRSAPGLAPTWAQGT